MAEFIDFTHEEYGAAFGRQLVNDNRQLFQMFAVGENTVGLGVIGLGNPIRQRVGLVDVFVPHGIAALVIGGQIGRNPVQQGARIVRLLPLCEVSFYVQQLWRNHDVGWL